MAKGKLCCVCESDNLVSQFNNTGKYYCRKHYTQLYQYGKIFERTKFDANEFVIYEDYAEIVLYDKTNKEIARAVISIEDVEKCKNHKWYLGETGYPSTHIGDKNIHLHRFIMENECGVVDHIDKDKLNNKKDNLRIVTPLDNAQNRTFEGIVGVKYVGKTNRWESYIAYNHKVHRLGSYNDYGIALKVRLLFEKELFKNDLAPQRDLFDIYLNEDDKLEDYMVLPKKNEKQSGVKGVTWQTRDEKWRVRYQSVVLGYFDNLDDAIVCRLKYEKEHFGDNAPQIALFEQYGID